MTPASHSRHRRKYLILLISGACELMVTLVYLWPKYGAEKPRLLTMMIASISGMIGAFTGAMSNKWVESAINTTAAHLRWIFITNAIGLAVVIGTPVAGAFMAGDARWLEELTEMLSTGGILLAALPPIICMSVCASIFNEEITAYRDGSLSRRVADDIPYRKP